MSTSALVPVAALSLYDLEDNLQALLNSEELVSAEQEVEYREAVTAAMTASVEKRNRMYQFLRHLDTSSEAVSKEIARLQARKKLFANTEKRVREYIIHVIEGLGPDAKGKPQKLSCDMCTFSLRNKADRVVIGDESSVPSEFKAVSIKLPLDTWRELLESTFDQNASPEDPETELYNRLLVADSLGSIRVEADLVEKAIHAGGIVPGADLEMGEVSLVVR